MKFKIDEKILQEVIDYLQEKPFKEVNTLISKLIQGAERVDEDIKPTKVEVEKPKVKGKKDEN